MIVIAAGSVPVAPVSASTSSGQRNSPRKIAEGKTPVPRPRWS